MKTRIRIFTALLLCALCATPAFGTGSDAVSISHAEKLTALHLLRGTGVNPDGSPIYSLDQTPTRLQGLIMMIRFLGEEDDALTCDPESPFLDVSGEGEQYVAYAYRRGVTNGTTDSTFTPSSPLSANAYAAFLLRAMGYSESAGDYTWHNVLQFAVSLGILSASDAASMEADGLNRGDMVDMSYHALTCPVKDGNRTLATVLLEKGVFTAEEGRKAGVLPAQNNAMSANLPWEADSSSISYEKKSFHSASGLVTAHILTVNTRNPKVRVKTALVDNRLGHTASFTKIVQNSGGAAAVINGNFFHTSNDFASPVGHVMSDGAFVYANSGLTSIGFSADGSVQIGRPAVFTRLTSGDDEWTAYEINTPEQTDHSSVLYTPAYGEQVGITNNGWALTADQGKITEFYSISAGASIKIPSEGYVVYMGGGYSAAPSFRIPQKGEPISMEYYLRVPDEEGFDLEGVTEIVSGAPRLVQNGKICTDLEEGFTESRFTSAATSRTAIGVNGDGELLFISVPAGATIQQMRELSLSIGCTEAVNLDGGASSAMYYRGNYLTVPGRELSVTLQVFVDE